VFIALVASVVACPRAALTQQPTKIYRIAVVHPSLPVSQMTETSDLPRWRVLFEELRLLGYVEGQNLVVERYSGEGREQNYAQLAHDVVHLNPDLIYAQTTRKRAPPLTSFFRNCPGPGGLLGSRMLWDKCRRCC
jgi:putative ABC transport system substrate-binding protein